MSIREMCNFLGISHATIERRLSEAQARLKEEILAMIETDNKVYDLPSSFTFRIVEIIKGIRIQPIPPTKALPWGLSLATGLIIAVLGIGTHINPIEMVSSSISSLGESTVLDIGEFPVDVMKVSDKSVMSNGQMNGDGLSSVVPSMQNALFMAPQAEGGTWTKKGDMPTSRWLLSTNVVDGKIYAVSGFTGAEFTTRLDVYDPTNNVWTRKSDFPIPIQGGSASAINGKIYAMGGMIDGGIITAKVHEYDPEKDLWTRKADMITGRWIFSTATANGKIYAIGGGNVFALVGGLCFPGNTTASVEEYDPIADTWTKKADMPAATNGSACAVVNDKIYVIGGEDDDMTRTFSNVWEFDPVKNTWTKKADMPTKRAMLTAEILNGKIYAIGGGNNIMESKTYSIVEEYDPVIDKWIRKADMPTPRSALSSAVVNGKIYALGGTTAPAAAWSPLPTVEEYDPGISESINLKGKLPTTWGETKTALNR